MRAAMVVLSLAKNHQQMFIPPRNKRYQWGHGRDLEGLLGNIVRGPGAVQQCEW